MTVILVLALLGLCVVVGVLWQRVQEMSTREFLGRLGGEEARTIRDVQARRRAAEARLRQFGRFEPRQQATNQSFIEGDLSTRDEA